MKYLQSSDLQLRCTDEVLWSAKCFTGRIINFPYLENRESKVKKKKYVGNIGSVNGISSRI